MINRPNRKTKNGKTILEEIDGYDDIHTLQNYNDMVMLEDEFVDMQLIICDILGKLSDTLLDNSDINCISTLNQACTTILEKINTKLLI